MLNALLKELPTDPGVVLMYAVPGKEGFYEKLGFYLLKTGMGHFTNPEDCRRQGYI